MLRERLIFTALPNGMAGTKLRVSAFVSPRLEADAGDGSPKVGAYPRLASWPTTLAGLTFSVDIDGVLLPATRVGPPLRADLWRALFGTAGGSAGGPVTPYRPPDHEHTKVRSFPVRDIHDYVRREYVELARSSPDDHPGGFLLGIGDGFAGLATLGDDSEDGQHRRTEIIDRLESSLLEEGYVYVDPTSDGPGGSSGAPPHRALVQAELFHSRDQIRDAIPRNPTTPLAPVAPPAFDFHQLVSALGEYPKLLRLLGLVVDLEVALPSGGLPSTVNVRVIPNGLPTDDPRLVVRSMSTRASAGGGRFLAASGDPQMVDGYLNLADDDEHFPFDVVDADVDGLALKLLDYGNNLRRSALQGSLDTPDAHPPPSIRTSGLSVVRRGRSQAVRNALYRQSSLQAALTGDTLDQVPLQAEDLVRGYRVDVWDDATGKWHTICARRGTYRFPGGLTEQLDDEGAVTIGATKGHPGIEDDLFLHESLFRWSGWSAVAPRPGKTIDKDDANGLTVPENPADPNFPLKVAFAPTPGTLPKLRYGTTYRFRVRLVDLAGNSVPMASTATDWTAASEPLRFGRFDPVQSPFVLPRRPLTPGEAAETLVVRSNYNTAATGPTSERHVAPAKIAELMAEEHGLFDAGGRPNKGAYNGIAGTEAKSFGTMGALDPSAPPPPPPPAPASSGARYYDVAYQPVPFIPDPLAKGATLRGVPGAPNGGLVQVPFAPAPPRTLLETLKGPAPVPPAPYPNGYSFRIVTAEGTGAPTFDPKTRVLTVRLPKGTTSEVRLSSYVAAADLKALAFWRWLEEDIPAAELTDLRGLATTGQLWQLTPFRTMRLVHAVRQPLLPPRFTKPVALRELGDTFATVLDTLSLSRKSTSRVDVRADWNEYVDKPEDTTVPASDPSVPLLSSASPFAFTVDYGDNDTLAIDHRHELHDTRHRFVLYTAIATSRYAEHFTQSKDVTLGTAEVLVEPVGFVPGSVVVRSQDGTRTFAAGADYTANEATGKLTRVPTGAIAANSTVRTSYVAPPITRLSTEVQPPVLIDVPSSARPAPPKVKYVIPTFGWASSGSAVGKTSTRKGGGLRIYLDRPWWSSGEGEQLGVVLWRKPAGQSDPPLSMSNLVTQLGLDPLWVTGATTENPTAAAFPLAVVPATNLTLPELPGGPTVDVAPHAVGYDKVRQLWYADIVVDPGKSYTPFVRLALARYQLHSVPGAHLSSVVLADFAQLAPDRSASVSYAIGSNTKVNVALTGLSQAGSRAKDNSLRAGPNEARVMVQVKRPGVTGELAWMDSPTFAEQPLTPVANPDGTTTWSGQVILPAARGSQPLRLLFREHETHSFDGTGYGPGDPRQTATTAKRLVYVDTLEI